MLRYNLVSNEIPDTEYYDFFFGSSHPFCVVDFSCLVVVFSVFIVQVSKCHCQKVCKIRFLVSIKEHC